MQTPDRETTPRPLAEEAVATARRWLAQADAVAPAATAGRLTQVLEDPDGPSFAVGFVDRVVRPDDLHVAGKGLEQLAQRIPRVLPWYMRSALAVGGGFAAVIPWPIVPIARRVMRRMVGHLLVEVTGPADPQLTASIARLRGSHARVSLALLGESVQGDGEALARLAEIRELLARDDVESVSIDLADVVSHLSLWAFDETVDRVVERLAPLYEFAAASSSRKFITLEMGMSRYFDLTLAVFVRLLERQSLRRLEAGITLQAYLPASLAALHELTHWASARRAEGGAGIRVRIVKGAYLPLERVDAALNGWPLAPFDSKPLTDAQFKRMLSWALTPARTDAVRISVAGHNLFDIAYAWLLAKARGVERRIEFEMMLGMGVAQDAVAADVGAIVLSVPVVVAGRLDRAVDYLVRRLDENVGEDHFLARARGIAADEEAFAAEAARFTASVIAADEPARPADGGRPSGTRTPLTDPAIAANRRWARGILDRAAASQLGQHGVEDAQVADRADLERRIAATATAGTAWGQRRPGTRAEILHSIGDELEASRARLIETMVGETGATFAEADAEVSVAIDHARRYTDLAPTLDAVDNARFVPSRLTVVATLERSPVAVPAASMLAALAAGNGVILMPARHARRSAAVLAEALESAGLPRDVVTLIDLDKGELGDSELARILIAHPRVDRVLFTGRQRSARLFRSWRADAHLAAETGGTNAIVVTPSADLDRAVADVVASAFGSAGQGPSAASILILVGTLANSRWFRRQLVDAVSTLRIGYPHHPASDMGPISQPAAGEVARALTGLGEGEEWLVEPHRLDPSGRLWSPGVRDGVAPDSEFHLAEHRAPVLGIMRAADLSEAIDLQNAMPFAHAGGLHSWNPDEVATWLRSVELGELFVNRGAVASAAKRSGANTLLTLGSWEPVFPEPKESVVVKGVSRGISDLIEAAQPGMDYLGFDRVRAGARSDQIAWDTRFGQSRAVGDLRFERSVIRYRPIPVAIRLSEDAPGWALARVLAAAMRAGAPVGISSATPITASLVQFLRDETTAISVTEVVIEADARWYARLRSGETGAHRIRLLSGDPSALVALLGAGSHAAIYAEPVTAAGEIELLPFLREQSVSITAHRFGHPDAGMVSLAV